MGFNSALMVLNDRLHDIERDTEFGAKVADAVSSRIMHHAFEPVEFAYQSLVLSCQHADCTQVVAVHGNTGFVLDYTGRTLYNPQQHDRANPHPNHDPGEQMDGWDRLTLLRTLAAEMGYELHRKRGQRK